MAKANVARKPQEVEIPAQEAIPAQVPVSRTIHLPESAPVVPVKGPIVVTLDLEGRTIDVASVALVSGERMMSAGSAMRDLCYNILNGVLSPEVRDTTSQCWKGVPNPVKTAFRKLRKILDGDEKTPTHGLPQGERAAFIRNAWARHVAETAAKRDKAKAEGKKSSVRVREITLSALSGMFKGAAPKGGGINGLKEKMLAALNKIKKAFDAKNPAAFNKFLKEAETLCDTK